MEQRKYDMDFVARVLKVFSDYDDVGSLHWVTGKYGDNEQSYYPASFFVNCSDCFGWGTADGEDVTPENIHILEQSYADVKAITPITCYGPMLFACRVRGMRPQGAAYPKDEPGLWPLFDACGPIRETGIGNPRPSPIAVSE